MARSKIENVDLPMPEINPDKVCFIIGMARRLGAVDEGIEPDASNPADDGERIALTEAGGAVRRELVEYLRALDADETAALLALAWIGRGDYEAIDWKRAVTGAANCGDRDRVAWRELLDIPLLADFLEDALSAFGQSCEDFEMREGA